MNPLTDQRDETIDVLESLLAHPGWAILSAAARTEAEDKERQDRDKALLNDDKRAVRLLRQSVAARKAVEWVLAWPAEEMAKRRRMAQGRAGLPQDTDEWLAQMTRRGTL